MNEKSYRYLLYLISVVITITLAIQVYWNYKNYKESERQLKIDLQTTLDQSVEDYFTIQAKNNTISIIETGNGNSEFKISNILKKIDFNNLEDNDELLLPEIKEMDGVTILRGVDADTLKQSKIKSTSEITTWDPKKPEKSVNQSFKITNLSFKDEKSVTELQQLTNRIVFSIKSDKVIVKRLDSIFKSQLKVKNISIIHQLTYSTPDSIYQTQLNSFSGESITSLSELIDSDNELELNYRGLNMNVLKRNLTGILLSTLLITSVILCLFYLLNVIKKQKNINEMKNDLISNITHEFKTPIATTSVALEGVQNFTNTGDTEKTNRYLNMGREQLTKLNNMVEKLLETASLDGKELDLQKGEVTIDQIITSLITKFQPQTSKQIEYLNHSKDSNFMADGFHLENALNNLIDNAIKYGGDNINIDLFKTPQQFEIIIADSGTGLKAKDAKYIFDQFSH